MNTINIPKLIKLESNYTNNNKNMFEVASVLDFYIENNSLLYLLNNSGDTNKIKCIKNYNNDYKIFAYKTLGTLSHTIYFLLDINKQVLYQYDGGFYATSDILKEWVDYLLQGGTYEKAIEYNKSMDNGFNPFEGI